MRPQCQQQTQEPKQSQKRLQQPLFFSISIYPLRSDVLLGRTKLNEILSGDRKFFECEPYDLHEGRTQLFEPSETK
ncbi:Uncharacterised protein [Salmonella enterica subsp. enterica serovar Bovismorbificans]|nr:Uncharacterised protein [Salmonella enterica subsp. enterica serovar Bovismorbificans]